MADAPSPLAILSSPGLYQICVAGRIDSKWAEYLHGMTITTIERSGKAGGVMTELSGLLPDQAALMGVLWQLYSLGVGLISVRCSEYQEKSNQGR